MTYAPRRVPEASTCCRKSCRGGLYPATAHHPDRDKRNAEVIPGSRPPLPGIGRTGYRVTLETDRRGHLRSRTIWRATGNNLRLNPERRMVDHIFPGWNRVREWLKQLNVLKQVA